jgi:hypothetical protein
MAAIWPTVQTRSGSARVMFSMALRPASFSM